MNYCTYEPTARLNHYIKCFWTLEAKAVENPDKQRIVPDGCMELIFHYGDLFKQYTSKNESLLQPRCFVFGQIIKPLEILPTGRIGIISARFYPDGFRAFTNHPLEKFSNKAVTLTKVFGNKAALFEQNVLLAKTNKQRVKLIEAFLLQKIALNNTEKSISKQYVNTILAENGQLTIAQLADHFSITKRTLERKISTATGISPKQLSKVIRLHTILKALEEDRFKNLTTLAVKAGYYDQAHFINDFKEFTGVTPKGFYTDNLRMSQLFIA